MNATADITFDRAYFEIFYHEWRRYRSRWRRFAVPLALVTLIAAFVFLGLVTGGRAIGIGLLAYGLCQVYDVATHRSRWIRGRLKDLPQGKQMKVMFHDDCIELETPHSSGTVDLDALVDVIPTPTGLFLIINTGISLFIPKTSVEPTDAFPKITDLLLSSIAKQAGANGSLGNTSPSDSEIAD